MFTDLEPKCVKMARLSSSTAEKRWVYKLKRDRKHPRNALYHLPRMCHTLSLQ